VGVQSPLAVPVAGPPPPPPPSSRLRRLDRFEIALLAAFGTMSMWVVALDVFHAARDSLTWTGTDGYYIVDQMQYLSWVQSAAHHGLISNLFVLRSTPSDFFQPAILISGAVAAVGVPSWLALLLWKPVAVVTLFLAMRAVVNRTFIVTVHRNAALALGLLFGSFTVIFGVLGIVGDLMPTWLSWGYPFGLMAVALITFAVVRYDRMRVAGRPDWICGLLGGLASTLHPWQGETLILLIILAELVRWRDLLLWWRTAQWRRLALPALTLALTGLPLLYYLLLGHLDLSWKLARVQSKHAFPFSAIAIGIAPLAIPALLGYRGRSESMLELLLRVWGPATILIYIFSATGLSATPLHAFDGITVPLAVLAVKGVTRTSLRTLPRGGWGRVLATGVVALGIIPANAYALATAHQYVDPAGGNANFITHDEHAALRYLAKNRDPGGVLTQFYLGEAVPGATGRRTFVGNCLWSEPNCMPRSEAADALFRGQDTREQATQLVRQSGARFLLASCAPHADLSRRLGELIVSTTHFGCATVYELEPPGEAEGPLAELPSDAAFRAPRRQ
jgi:hypothetical protein